MRDDVAVLYDADEHNAVVHAGIANPASNVSMDTTEASIPVNCPSENSGTETISAGRLSSAKGSLTKGSP